MRVLGLIVSMALMSVPAFGDDVPFAAPQSERTQAASETYASTLSDIMGLTQLRHIKLWYAGRARNWKLANFEIGQIEETFGKAAMLYRNIPIELIASGSKPLEALRKAATEKDPVVFAKAFEDLNNSCNDCHRAAQVGFIKIQTPTSSPFTNQQFNGVHE